MAMKVDVIRHWIRMEVAGGPMQEADAEGCPDLAFGSLAFNVWRLVPTWFLHGLPVFSNKGSRPSS